MTKLEKIDDVFDGFIDAVYETEDPRETEYERLAALPDATFHSVFGKAVYAHARERLSNAAAYYGYSQRDRDAYWPTALTDGLRAFSDHKLAKGLDGTPTQDNIKTAIKRSDQFLDGWKLMTGNDMKGGQLSAHQRLQIAKGVPENFRSSARELRDTGVTGFVEKQIRRGNELAYGERNRADAAAKRIRVRSKPEEIR
ncbi:MAG: hypothetical protein KBT64_14420 [Sulfitobacter litoralis]|nr:hypothetical protein [Sulfitobacter litoralis]